MHIKVFKLEQEKEVNEFVGTQIVPDNGIQVTSDGNVIVFYEEDQKGYLNKLIKNIERELFYENIRLVSAEIELEKAKAEISIEDVVEDVQVTKTGHHKAVKQSEAQTLVSKKEEAVQLCKDHIELFKTKIDAYKSKLAELN